MKVLGLDLSLTSTGVALPDGQSQTIAVKTKGMERCAAIAKQILVHALRADVVALEGYAMGSARQSHSYSTGELGGIVRHYLWKNTQTYVDIPPASLKKYATGKGNAGKEEVLAAAIRRLDYAGHSNDEADALFLRQMALDAYGHAEVVMPASHRAALASISWPELDQFHKEAS